MTGKNVPCEARSWLWLNDKVWASKLTCLHLQNMTVLCDKKSWTLQHLTRLQHLSISGARLPPKDVQHLVQQLHSCQQLTGLQLTSNDMWELPEQGWEGVTGLKVTVAGWTRLHVCRVLPPHACIKHSRMAICCGMQRQVG